MTSNLKRAAILAVMLAIPAGMAVAQPFGPGPFGPGPYGAPYGPPAYGPPFGPGGYYGGSQVDRSKVDAAVKETLGKATAGNAWTTPVGTKVTPILVDNQIVGQLWRNADLKTLSIGSYWEGPWGMNVQLVKNGEVVGMLWVKVS